MAKLLHWDIERTLYHRSIRLGPTRRIIIPSPLTRCNDSYQLLAQTTRHALGLNEIDRDVCLTGKARSTHFPCHRARNTGSAFCDLDIEVNSQTRRARIVTDHLRHHEGFTPLLLAKPPRLDQRNVESTRRIGTPDSARPNPGHNGLSVNRRVEASKSVSSNIAHPLAVRTHVCCKSGWT